MFAILVRFEVKPDSKEVDRINTDSAANLRVEKGRNARGKQNKGRETAQKREQKTVIKTLLTRQRKLVRKRGPPIEGRGITWMLALVIKSKRN